MITDANSCWASTGRITRQRGGTSAYSTTLPSTSHLPMHSSYIEPSTRTPLSLTTNSLWPLVCWQDWVGPRKLLKPRSMLDCSLGPQPATSPCSARQGTPWRGWGPLAIVSTVSATMPTLWPMCQSAVQKRDAPNEARFGVSSAEDIFAWEKVETVFGTITTTRPRSRFTWYLVKKFYSL